MTKVAVLANVSLNLVISIVSGFAEIVDGYKNEQFCVKIIEEICAFRLKLINRTKRTDVSYTNNNIIILRF